MAGVLVSLCYEDFVGGTRYLTKQSSAFVYSIDVTTRVYELTVSFTGSLRLAGLTLVCGMQCGGYPNGSGF